MTLCRFIKYQAKDQALGDAIRYLKENDNLDVDEGLKLVRELSKKQYSAMVKWHKMMRFAQQNGY